MQTTETPSPGQCGKTRFERLSTLIGRLSPFLLCGFVVGYGVVTWYLATQRLFWFDEFFTVHLSRLPGFDATWQALLMQADFNPPLFYELTRLSERLLGAGPAQIRLPSIVGFGVFCLCLYRFVSVRAPVFAAFVALLFPFATGIYWYAYEARAYGALLGFGGLSLVCWQLVAARTERRLWALIGLTVFLACGMLTHAYGVLFGLPLAMGELWRAVERKRIDWPVWIALAVSLAGIFPSFILLTSVLAAINEIQTTVFDASVAKLFDAYRSYLAPALGILLGGLALALFVPDREAGGGDRQRVPGHEYVALATFLLVPAVACAMAAVTGAPFMSRYGLPAVAGFSCLLGLGLRRRPAAAAGALALLVVQIFVGSVHLARNPTVIEPTTGYEVSNYSPHFMRRYGLMNSAANKDAPIVLLDNLDFLPTIYYAPEGLRDRLVYLPRRKGEVTGLAIPLFRKCCNVPGRTATDAELLEANREFYVYGTPRSSDKLNYFREAGATVTVESMTASHFLATVTRNPR